MDTFGFGVVAFIAAHFITKYLEKVSGTARPSFYYESMAVLLIVICGAAMLGGAL